VESLQKSSETEIPEYDEGARKLLLLGYIARIFTQIFPYVGGIGLVISSTGWLRHYSRVEKKLILLILVLALMVSGLLHIYVDYTKSLLTYTVPSIAQEGEVKLSEIKELLELTVAGMGTVLDIILYGLLALTFTIEAFIIKYVAMLYRKAFYSWLWIMFILIGVLYFALIPTTINAANGINEMINEINETLQVEGDRVLNESEVISFIMGFTSFLFPVMAISVVLFIVRLVTMILSALGFHKIPKVIERLKLFQELKRPVQQGS